MPFAAILAIYKRPSAEGFFKKYKTANNDNSSIEIHITCFLIKPEKRGFKLKKQTAGTTTANKARRLLEKTINTANAQKKIYNGTLCSLFFDLKIKTTMMLQVIESRHAKRFGFNIVPTGYGAPCNNCRTPA
ncbi:MAG: hypothetical protein IKX55_00340 [Bacteroidaceae bacterium]|nr:hypothetical protein [Bacteroidaceae bacterium]